MMKKMRKMAGASVFVFAIALAFAFSDAEAKHSLQGYFGRETQPPNDCVEGVLQQPESLCDVNNTGDVCTVIIHGGTPQEEEVSAHLGDTDCSPVTLLRRPATN